MLIINQAGRQSGSRWLDWTQINCDRANRWQNGWRFGRLEVLRSSSRGFKDITPPVARQRAIEAYNETMRSVIKAILAKLTRKTGWAHMDVFKRVYTILNWSKPCCDNLFYAKWKTCDVNLSSLLIMSLVKKFFAEVISFMLKERLGVLRTLSFFFFFFFFFF